MWRRRTVGWFSVPLIASALVVGCTGTTPSLAAPSDSSSATGSSSFTSPASPRPSIPPVAPGARAVGFVDVRTVVPDAIIDLRYATANNFVGTQLYPRGARCLVHQSMAPGLRAAARAARGAGDRIVFWDCYRPHSVQVTMFRKVPDPAWVAKPGPYSTSHESGRSVDVTLATRASACPTSGRTAGWCALDMGTRFDDFSPRATAFATNGVSSAAQANRARLRNAMAAGGLTVYSGEWWHFDGPGADVRRPIIDVPLD